MSPTLPPANPWLLRLTNLNLGTGPQRKPAPHKPLMLLCVIDLVESGDLTEPILAFGVALTQRFRDYWGLVAGRQGNVPDMRLPFHHLGSDGVWQPLTVGGDPSVSKDTTRQCRLDPGLWRDLASPDFRLALRRALVARYFEPVEQAGLCARLSLPEANMAQVQQTLDDAAAWKAAQQRGRDGRFKAEVLAGYHYTCALTGYRLMTDTSALVQAAHIEQHAETGNDDPYNGLALTPDAHWAFDNGLWTVRPTADALLVVVKHGAFDESELRLGARHGQPLHFHPHARLRPKAEYFRWHAHHWRFGLTS